MKAVIQRVSKASVAVDGKVAGSIGRGLLVYIGVSSSDTADDAVFVGRKIAELRIFEDEEGKMNRSIGKAAGRVSIPPRRPISRMSCMKKSQRL